MWRLNCAIILFFAFCSSAFAQVINNSISEPCVAVRNEDPRVLEQRRNDLNAAILETRARAEQSKPANAQSSPNSNADRDAELAELSRKEAELIEIIYKQECFRPDLAPDPDASRGDGSVVEVTTFYATNRRKSGATSLSDFYNADDTRQIEYGTSTVSIPSKHRMGELELPHLWKLERNPDPTKHFVVKSIIPLESNAALAALGDAIGKSREKSLLLFVHGFNVSFYEAALRTAQLAHDLRFPGIAMFYSWPSAGQFWGYLHDEESAELARSVLDAMLDDISRLDIDNVYIVAHSMGNRIVGSALASRVQSNKDVGKIREILLAAPDINAQIFKTEIAPQLQAMRSAHKTIYASSRDLALAASKVVHGFRRVGESTNGVLTFPGMETIDASQTAPMVRAFGHSYVLDSVSVLHDVEDILVWQRSMAQRTVAPVGVPPDEYWQLK
jgi:esterase/lipase superfamily enzyme